MGNDLRGQTSKYESVVIPQYSLLTAVYFTGVILLGPIDVLKSLIS